MLPGCQNGHCQNEPFECICDETEKWTGDHCDERKKFQNYNIYTYIVTFPSLSKIFVFVFQQFVKLVVSMELAKVLENVCKFFFGGKYLQFLNL